MKRIYNFLDSWPDDENLPTGNPLMVLYRFIGAAHSPDKLERNDSSVTAGTDSVMFRQKDAQCTVFFSNDLMPKSGKAKTEQYFAFLLSRIAEISVEKGKLVRNDFSFSVSDLVDCGMFESYRSAKKAVDSMNDFFSTVHVRLETK